MPPALNRALVIKLALAALLGVRPGIARADTAPSDSPRPLWQLSAYEPMYLLPAYYTFSPYDAIYGNTLPNGQTLSKRELKFQLSFKMALMSSGPAKNAYIAYTQSSYWQCYGN